MSEVSIVSLQRTKVPHPSAKVRRCDRFDLIVSGAQTLFAEDNWVSMRNVSKVLGISFNTISVWAKEKGSLIHNVLHNYQKLQHDLGLSMKNHR